MPIGPLMKEHRLIERMIALMERELFRLTDGEEMDPVFIDVAADFIRTYADRCHHGKEEDILFRQLAKKQLSDEEATRMAELVEEHAYGRRTTGELVRAKERYIDGDRQAASAIVATLENLVRFYPAHIEKEDKHFFVPVMEYFTKQEQERMLEEFWEFDRLLIHERYATMVESYE